MTKADLKQKLPPRSFWYAEEIAPLLGVSVSALQKRSKRNDIGKIKKRSGGGRGQRIYVDHDLDQLLVRRDS